MAEPHRMKFIQKLEKSVQADKPLSAKDTKTALAVIRSIHEVMRKQGKNVSNLRKANKGLVRAVERRQAALDVASERFHRLLSKYRHNIEEIVPLKAEVSDHFVLMQTIAKLKKQNRQLKTVTGLTALVVGLAGILLALV